MNDFMIDIRDLVQKGRRNLNKRVGSVTISTPSGISFNIEPHDPEVTCAREVIIFMRDRRVLNSKECCDGCIDRSLESLNKIREYLVGCQQKLANLSDGGLFLMIEFILDAIRQFMTYSERIETSYKSIDTGISDLRRDPVAREKYFTALNRLRNHCWQTLRQISHIANIDLPSVPEYLRLNEWAADTYIK